MPLKLYCLDDGPPSIAVRQLLAHLNLPCEVINLDYSAGDHLTEEYAKKNPQKQIPVLDDDGFYLSESNAILQYICDKYAPESNVYPKDPQQRAIVNHRLCFHLSTYYSAIEYYVAGPIFYNRENTPASLKKVHTALEQFNTYLKRVDKKYVAADHVTIADFQLVVGTMVLEMIDFDFSEYTEVSTWYNLYKMEQPKLWAIVKEGLELLRKYVKDKPKTST